MSQTYLLRYTERVSNQTRAPHIFLAGGGHAHLYYSGMATA